MDNFEEQQLPSPEEFLKNEATPFSNKAVQQTLNILANANDGKIIFNFSSRTPSGGVEAVKLGPSKTIINLPDDPKFDDVIAAAKFIPVEPELQDQNLSLLGLSKNLKDSSILLAKNSGFSGSGIDESLEFLYKLGVVIERKVKGEDTPLGIIKRQDLIKREIKPPDGTDPVTYENQLYLFLLGKEVILSENSQDLNLHPDPQHTFYSNLYLRWRQKKNIATDNENTREQFDQVLLRNKQFILGVLTGRVFDSLKDGRGQLSLKEIISTSLERELESRLIAKGAQLLLKDLKMTPNTGGLDLKLQQKLEELYPSGVEHEQLYQVIDQSLQALIEEKNKEKKPLSLYQRIALIWDIVQSYEHESTFIPTLAVKDRTMECNLKSWTLGILYKEFLGDEVVVLADSVPGHVVLCVIEREPEGELGKTYIVDPSDYEIYEINDPFVLKPLKKAVNTDPGNVNINLHIQGGAEKIIGPNHNIGDLDRIIQSNLWQNIGGLEKDVRIKYSCLMKALALNPNNSDAWNNLSICMTDINLERKLLNKALSLCPDSPFAWYNFACTFAEAKTLEDFKPYSVEEILVAWYKVVEKNKNDPDFFTVEQIEIIEDEIKRLKGLLA